MYMERCESHLSFFFCSFLFVGGFLQVFPQRKTAEPGVLHEDGTVCSSRSGFSWSNLSLSTLMILECSCSISHSHTTTPAVCILSYGEVKTVLIEKPVFLHFFFFFFPHACNYSKQSFMLIVHYSYGLQEKERQKIESFAYLTWCFFLFYNYFLSLVPV